MKTETKGFAPLKNIAALSPMLCIAVLLTGLCACSDSEFDSLRKTDREITFNVSAADPGTRTSSTGINNSRGTLSTLTLNTPGGQLYLIPEVSAGINRGSDSGYAETRGVAVNASTIENFGVYASLAGNTASGDAYYMRNVRVTRDNSWSPDKEYLWPGSGPLHITAYSPYCSTAADETTGGITVLPSDDASVTPSLSYVVPEDVTAQTDLMWANPQDASASPCAMMFNHALTAVRFVTGPEMAPCIVKSISISGLKNRGVLSLESGLWSDVEGNADYTADLDVNLTAEAGSGYVADRQEITDSEHTFILMPQTPGEGSQITLTIVYEGSTMEFTASISGQTWAAGNTYTYHLSANPVLDRFVLNVDSPLTFNYTGGKQGYNVTSQKETMKDGVLSTEEIPWKAEFVDDSGNVIATPSWITSMPLGGTGSMACEAVTSMVEPDFVQMSEATRRLRQNSAVGSAEQPYNLSNPTGAPTVMNTANCYVINAPGFYSLPLVYGNAIKDGADNTAAYAPTRTSYSFVNHLGNHIKHPYIYDNDGCSDAAGAELIWEGRLNLVKNVRLSDDGKSILFEIPSAFLRQGNAMIALRDSSGDIMWSWQLWITDYVPGDNLHTFTYNNAQYQLMPVNLGRIMGGDETDFASKEAKVRFTQVPADGSAGESVTVTVAQTGKHVITPDCHSFYQWGRKDPMISGVKEWYNADHTEITQIKTNSILSESGTVGSDYEAELVKHPDTFYILAMSGNPSFKNTNHWNLGTNAKKIKTVYDPCPPGYMVPGAELMEFRDMPASNYSFKAYGGFSDPAGFNVTGLSDGSTVFFPALGYRSGKSGQETLSNNDRAMTELWTSHANRTEAVALVIINESPIYYKMPDEARLEAFGIRPVHE